MPCPLPIAQGLWQKLFQTGYILICPKQSDLTEKQLLFSQFCCQDILDWPPNSVQIHTVHQMFASKNSKKRTGKENVLLATWLCAENDPSCNWAAEMQWILQLYCTSFGKLAGKIFGCAWPAHPSLISAMVMKIDPMVSGVNPTEM